MHIYLFASSKDGLHIFRDGHLHVWTLFLLVYLDPSLPRLLSQMTEIQRPSASAAFSRGKNRLEKGKVHCLI